MARGDWNILDIQIDLADRRALKRVNAAFELGLPEPQWWQLTWGFRERVREALRARWSR
jgi:hypothetical protein